MDGVLGAILDGVVGAIVDEDVGDVTAGWERGR